MPCYKLGKYVNAAKCRCKGRASKNSRYLLQVPFNSKKCKDGEDVIVIMLNPSSSAKARVYYKVPFADLEDIDTTTNNVLELLQKGVILDDSTINVRRVTLLNLFPYFSPNQRDINVIYSASSTEMFANEKEIDYRLSRSESGIVLVGWGKAHKSSISTKIYRPQIEKIKQMLHYHKCRCYEYDAKSSKFMNFNPIGKKCYVSHASKWR